MKFYVVFVIMLYTSDANHLIKSIVRTYEIAHNEWSEKLNSIHKYFNIDHFPMEDFINIRNIPEDLFKKNSNALCVQDLNLIFKASANKDLWALLYLDSSSKIPAGLMNGAITWGGSYSECIYMDVLMPKNSTLRAISSQFCTANFYIPFKFNPISFRVSYCLPKSCSNLELEYILNSIMKEVTTQFKLKIECRHGKDITKHDSWFSTFVALFSILGIALLTASTFEFVLYLKWILRKPNEVQNDNNDERDTARLLYDSPDNQSGYQQFRQCYLKQTPYVRYLLAFSVPENARKVFYTTSKKQKLGSKKPQLECFNGIRLLTMSWVVLGHCVAILLQNSNNAYFFLKQQSRQWSIQAIIGASVSVDTFFFMSGFLTTFISLPKLRYVHGFWPRCKFWSLFIVHRWVRLTPLWLISITLFVGLLPHVGEGPTYPLPQDQMFEDCRNNWYWSYLSNFINSEHMCMPWTWYISNEMQFSIILAPIFLTLVIWKWWMGIGFALALIATSIGTNVNDTLRFNLGPGFLGALVPEFVQFYIRPYNRWAAYAVGLCFGWLQLQKPAFLTNRSLKKSLLLSVTGLAIATPLMLTAVYALYGEMSGWLPTMTTTETAAFNALVRPVWSLGVGIVVLLCTNGLAPPINAFLSCLAFVPLSRLTYAIYLIHPIVIFYLIGSGLQAVLIDNILIAIYFLGTLILSAGLGFILSMVVESPLLAIENMLHG